MLASFDAGLYCAWARIEIKAPCRRLEARSSDSHLHVCQIYQQLVAFNHNLWVQFEENISHVVWRQHCKNTWFGHLQLFTCLFKLFGCVLEAFGREAYLRFPCLPHSHALSKHLGSFFAINCPDQMRASSSILPLRRAQEFAPWSKSSWALNIKSHIKF